MTQYRKGTAEIQDLCKRISSGLKIACTTELSHVLPEYTNLGIETRNFDLGVMSSMIDLRA